MGENPSKPNEALERLFALIGDELLRARGQELDELVQAWGIVPASALGIVDAAFKKALQISNRQRLAEARKTQELEVAKLRRISVETDGTREELLLRLNSVLETMRRENPEGATLEHRNLDQYTEEYLRSLLAQLSALE